MLFDLTKALRHGFVPTGLVLCITWSATAVFAQDAARVDTTLLPIQTDSPRETLATFLRLADDVETALQSYREDPSRETIDQIRAHSLQMIQLLDLSAVPSASRAKVGRRVAVDLLDILGRVALPSPESVPDADSFDDVEELAKWRIPRTPITIVQIEEGPREGEFLFSQRSVAIAPGYYERIKHLPLRSSIGIDSWNDMVPQLHGALIPDGFVSALPDNLKELWLDTPIWKIALVVFVGLLTIALMILWYRFLARYAPESRMGIQAHLALTPLAVLLSVYGLEALIAADLNIFGRFALVIDFTTTLVFYVAAAWVFWPAVMVLFEWMIRSPKIPEDSLHANILRLSARVIGFIGIASILGYGASELGVPVLGVFAGLGLGGVAVALAIRPTLENLIGGVILFMDKPVLVGDFCSFGNHMGTVEYIGMRSTNIRALDRTLITIPNAAFADMEIINWAKCDRMLIQRTIGLRYETEPDQLRYVLVKLREMCYAHPKIDRDTVRVRFEGHGASSLDVQIRVYALTREWNQFFAIQEDIFLRVDEIVRASGTGFAFPSQTVYFRRDDGLDAERSASVMQEVTAWRRSRRLPFPFIPPREIDQLQGKLDYPPMGSPDAASPEAQATEASELLSAEEPDADAEEGEKKGES